MPLRRRLFVRLVSLGFLGVLRRFLFQSGCRRVGLPHDLVGLFRLGPEEKFLKPTDRHRLLANHIREVSIRIEDLLNQLGIVRIERGLGPVQRPQIVGGPRRESPVFGPA